MIKGKMEGIMTRVKSGSAARIDTAITSEKKTEMKNTENKTKTEKTALTVMLSLILILARKPLVKCVIFSSAPNILISNRYARLMVKIPYFLIEIPIYQDL